MKNKTLSVLVGVEMKLVSLFSLYAFIYLFIYIKISLGIFLVFNFFFLFQTSWEFDIFCTAVNAIQDVGGIYLTLKFETMHV